MDFHQTHLQAKELPDLIIKKQHLLELAGSQPDHPDVLALLSRVYGDFSAPDMDALMEKHLSLAKPLAIRMLDTSIDFLKCAKLMGRFQEWGSNESQVTFAIGEMNTFLDMMRILFKADVAPFTKRIIADHREAAAFNEAALPPLDIHARKVKLMHEAQSAHIAMAFAYIQAFEFDVAIGLVAPSLGATHYAQTMQAMGTNTLGKAYTHMRFAITINNSFVEPAPSTPGNVQDKPKPN